MHLSDQTMMSRLHWKEIEIRGKLSDLGNQEDVSGKKSIRKAPKAS